jgi:hypothetical protein
VSVNTQSILAEIDVVLARYEEVEKQYRVDFHHAGQAHDYIKAPEIVEGEIIALLRSAIERLAPAGYGDQALAGVGKNN